MAGTKWGLCTSGKIMKDASGLLGANSGCCVSWNMLACAVNLRVNALARVNKSVSYMPTIPPSSGDLVSLAKGYINPLYLQIGADPYSSIGFSKSTSYPVTNDWVSDIDGALSLSELLNIVLQMNSLLTLVNSILSFNNFSGSIRKTLKTVTETYDVSSPTVPYSTLPCDEWPPEPREVLNGGLLTTSTLIEDVSTSPGYANIFYQATTVFKYGYLFWRDCSPEGGGYFPDTWPSINQLIYSYVDFNWVVNFTPSTQGIESLFWDGASSTSDRTISLSDVGGTPDLNGFLSGETTFPFRSLSILMTPPADTSEAASDPTRNSYNGGAYTRVSYNWPSGMCFDVATNAFYLNGVYLYNNA